jgi:hypothetical protein
MLLVRWEASGIETGSRICHRRTAIAFSNIPVMGYNMKRQGQASGSVLAVDIHLSVTSIWASMVVTEPSVNEAVRGGNR